jgi:hypothetical protein
VDEVRVKSCPRLRYTSICMCTPVSEGQMSENIAAIERSDAALQQSPTQHSDNKQRLLLVFVEQGCSRCFYGKGKTSMDYINVFM